jgi:hypothetical protein
MMRNSDGRSEMMVTVKKEKLLEILRTNHKTHVAEFQEAKKNYKEEVLKKLEEIGVALLDFTKKFAAAEFGQRVDYPRTSLDLPLPVSYAAEYERAIGMLELHTQDEMTLDMQSYKQYVEDDWEWSHQAKMSNSRYISAGR